MNATLTSTSTTRRLARALLVVLVTAVALSTLQSMPASAYAVQSTGKNPGRVTGYQMQGSHYNTCTHTTYYTCFTPWVVGPGPMVYRSPASRGIQKITVVYELRRWNGSSWVLQTQRIHTRYLRKGYSRLQMPRVDFPAKAGGYYRVRIGVAWSNRYDTRAFGARLLTYKHSGDYTCNTRYPCTAGAGWVWLRSPGV